MATKKTGKVKAVSERELKKKLQGTNGQAQKPSKPFERRGGERFEARLEVDVPLSNWEQVRKIYTTNISKGGLLFSVDGPATLPSSVELTLTLPDGAKVTLTSEVRHVSRREDGKEFDIGVQFQTLDAATRRVFETALAKL
jgi:hypothetical protein